MLVELPSLSHHVQVPMNWAFENCQTSQDTFFDSHIISSLKIQFESSILSLKKNQSTKVKLAIPDLGNIELSGTFVTRGKWRAGFPAGGLAFSFKDEEKSYHLIFENKHPITNSKVKEFSDLNEEELFLGEVFNYKLVSLLSSAHFKCRKLEIILLEPCGTEYRTNVLIVEDFLSRKAVDQPTPLLSKDWSILASSILNLHFTQSLIGNQDYSFDFTDDGKLRIHNVSFTQSFGCVSLIPFDFQFTAILTPNYHKHRYFSLEEEAEFGAYNLSEKLSKLPEDVDVSYLTDGISQAIKFAKNHELSDRLRDRFLRYFQTFDNNFRSNSFL